MNAGMVDLGTDLGFLGATMVAGTGGTINTSGGRIVLNVAAGDLGVANGGTLTVNAVIADGTQTAIDFWNIANGTGIVVLNAANTFSGTTNLQQRGDHWQQRQRRRPGQERDFPYQHRGQCGDLEIHRDGGNQ